LLVDANSYTYELMVGKDRNYSMKNTCISNTIPNKGNNKISELRTILQRESQNS
jgi:hypothetical protein